MKAIIDGRIYDTEKGVKVGEYNNGLSYSDFGWWEAGLYRTPRSGYYFLAGEGGAMTRFSRPVDNDSWSGGSKIIPLGEREAFEWAQQYLDVDTVEAEFSDLIEEA